MNGRDGALQEGDEIAALHRHPQAELSNRRRRRDQPLFDHRGLPQFAAPLSNPLRRRRRDRASAACSGCVHHLEPPISNTAAASHPAERGTEKAAIGIVRCGKAAPKSGKRLAWQSCNFCMKNH
jgi:hypothetical protein